MRFEHPLVLFVLIVVVAIGWWGVVRSFRRPPALRFPSLDVVRMAHPPAWGGWVWLPRVLQLLGLVAAVIALARPQVLDTRQMVSEGLDFVIALDMSGSMNAVDMPGEEILRYHQEGKEPPNRFEAARDIIKRFIVARDADRIGLVIFGSKAWLKFPLTLDKDAMNRILDGLVLDDGRRTHSQECTNQCTINGDATAIGDALARSYRRLKGSETKSRNIILITDGDNNAGKAAPDEVARFIAEESKDRPIRIYPFLVGTGENTYMPATNPFTGQELRMPNGMRRYELAAEPFPVNPALLKEIARITGGSYHEAPTEADFRKEFEELEKTAFHSPALHRWQEAFLPWVVLAFVLILAGELLHLTVWRRWP